MGFKDWWNSRSDFFKGSLIGILVMYCFFALSMFFPSYDFLASAIFGPYMFLLIFLIDFFICLKSGFDYSCSSSWDGLEMFAIFIWLAPLVYGLIIGLIYCLIRKFIRKRIGVNK